jgi:hypothetical protein
MPLEWLRRGHGEAAERAARMTPLQAKLCEVARAIIEDDMIPPAIRTMARGFWRNIEQTIASTPDAKLAEGLGAMKRAIDQMMELAESSECVH